jgi:ribosomal protein S18
MAEDNYQAASDQGPRGAGNRRYTPKPRFCQFCSDQTLEIDYKNHGLLRKFTTEEGKFVSAVKRVPAPSISVRLPAKSYAPGILPCCLLKEEHGKTHPLIESGV